VRPGGASRLRLVIVACAVSPPGIVGLDETTEPEWRTTVSTTRRKATGFGAAALTLTVALASGAVLADDTKEPPRTAAKAPDVKIAAAAPDLEVSLYADGTVAIRNTGAAAGGSLAVRLRCTPQPGRTGTPAGCGSPFNEQRIRIGGTAVVTHTYQLPLGGGSSSAPIKLQPGSQTVSQSGPGWIMIYPATPTWSPGGYEITAEVDVGNTFQESDETNNTATKSIQLP
jgi:hypothetical protein